MRIQSVLGAHKTRLPWDRAFVDKITRLRQEGLSWPNICARFGLSSAQTFSTTYRKTLARLEAQDGKDT